MGFQIKNGFHQHGKIRVGGIIRLYRCYTAPTMCSIHRCVHSSQYIIHHIALSAYISEPRVKLHILIIFNMPLMELKTLPYKAPAQLLSQDMFLQRYI